MNLSDLFKKAEQSNVVIAQPKQEVVELSAVPVRGSSNVHWAAHDSGYGSLFVGFANGFWYSYFDREGDLFNGLLDAESKGKYVNEVLRKLPAFKWTGSVEPVQIDGYPFPVLDWTLEEMEERIATVVDKNMEDGKVDWEKAHIALPADTPPEFADIMDDWITSDDGGSSHCDLSIGDKKKLGWIGNVEFIAVLEPAGNEPAETKAEPAEPEEVEEPEEPEVEEPEEPKATVKAQLANKKGKDPRWQRRVEGRDLEDYLDALMSCAASFQKSVGIEPVAFLPYDCPDEVKHLVESAGFSVHSGSDLPPVGAVAVGVHQD